MTATVCIGGYLYGVTDCTVSASGVSGIFCWGSENRGKLTSEKEVPWSAVEFFIPSHGQKSFDEAVKQMARALGVPEHTQVRDVRSGFAKSQDAAFFSMACGH